MLFTQCIQWICIDFGAPQEKILNICKGFSEIIGSYYFLHVSENLRFLLLVSNPPKFVQTVLISRSQISEIFARFLLREGFLLLSGR